MTVPAADFTREGYGAILERALELGYAVRTFADFQPPGETPVLLLRHDLDHSLRAALPLADLEAERGVHATYFVQVTCDFYNLLGREGRAAVARLAELGHEIGLHYDGRRYAAALLRAGPAGARAALRLDLSVLEDITGRPIVSASQHLPCDTASPFDVGELGLHEAYDPRFTRGDLTYVSDSLMAWRERTPHDLLDRRASFQFLAHPMKWAGPVTGFGAALRRCLQEECDSLGRLYDEIEPYYADLLRRRADLDAAFRARRGTHGDAER